jgi:hypothetical protein
MAVTAGIVAADQHARRSRRKIMTRFPTSNGSELQDRELRDDELDTATGGLVVCSILGILVGLMVPRDPPTTPPPATK